MFALPKSFHLRLDSLSAAKTKLFGAQIFVYVMPKFCLEQCPNSNSNLIGMASNLLGMANGLHNVQKHHMFWDL